MNKNNVIWQLLLGYVAALGCSVSFAQIQGNYFSHKDWEIACDNTGTCRVAGYQAEGNQPAISVLLQRAAGAQAQVSARVKLDPETFNAANKPLQLYILGKNQGTVQLDAKTAEGQLSAAQTQKLIQALQANQPIVWKGNNKTWLLSVQGASAVLLRMDDFQKRIGTNSALLRKANSSSVNVLKPKSIPKVNIQNYNKGLQTRYAVNAPTAKQLFGLIKKKTTVEDCPQLFDANFLEDDRVVVFPINGKNALVEVPCWRGAYNSGNGYWLMDRNLKQIKQSVTFSGSGFSEGQIFSNQRGRGIGDCHSTGEWSWNGQRFIQTYMAKTTQCKGFAGGAWEIPTLVYRVQLDS